MSNPPTAAAVRAAVTPKLRFEVFKRDKFQCQYCGKAAPEVVLHCDHIRPVVDGGDSDILNLITACSTCNGGKGRVPLDQHAELDKQKAMLDELEDRRQQLEMLLRWRQELRGIGQTAEDSLAEACSRDNYTPNDNGRRDIRKWLRKYALSELLQAADEAFDVYYKGDGDSWDLAFRKVPIFADIASQEAERPFLKRLLYIQAILRNRTGFGNTIRFLEHLVANGADLSEMESLAKRTDYITHFTKPYEDWLSQIGQPFGRRPY